MNPPVKFDLIKLRDVTDWWVLDVSLCAQQNESAHEIQLDKVEGHC
jgi:hypothetical protein